MEYQPFFITQDAIIINKNNQVLILCHNSEPERWLLPGGKIAKGEFWLEGLKREIQEETSIIDFEINSILDVSSWIEPEVGYYVVTFLCFVSGSPNIRLSDEHKNYVWISPNDLDKYNFWHPDIKKRIQKAFSTIAE
ncbi:hypothetical protein COS31_00440 [Candidatus Roizmanbacteria bacterium CG02_land_8_20_14_3_00_36_15]|nr:MAG: hypothetical protein COS31_00440 [Candidatus Roizmanbacteria bacterium CG02_land_8_20_14_3_00_36_15]PJA53610.1 MAG: hypothetical protein CO166_01255 [Candidatus Roizmanbacteria bacterium CG_4_9_14_3_um_filter_36_11]